jgi:hypothetical protein
VMSGAVVDDQARRFVQDDHLLVGIHDVEVNRPCRSISRDSTLCDNTTLCDHRALYVDDVGDLPWTRCDLETVPFTDLAARLLDWLTVEPHRTGVDQIGSYPSRKTGEGADSAIDSLSRQRRRHDRDYRSRCRLRHLEASASAT